MARYSDYRERYAETKTLKYLGSAVNILATCDEDMNHRIGVGWLKWQRNSQVFCDKRMPAKL